MNRTRGVSSIDAVSSLTTSRHERRPSISNALDTRINIDPLLRYERDVEPLAKSPLSPRLGDFIVRSAKAAAIAAVTVRDYSATTAARCSIVAPKLNVDSAVRVAPRRRGPFSNVGAMQAPTLRCAPMPRESCSGGTTFRTTRDDEHDRSIARLLATVQIGRTIPSARQLHESRGGSASAAAAENAAPRCGVLYMQRRSNNRQMLEMARLRATSQSLRAAPRAESRAEWSDPLRRQLGAHERPIAAIQGRSVADQIAARERERRRRSSSPKEHHFKPRSARRRPPLSGSAHDLGISLSPSAMSLTPSLLHFRGHYRAGQSARG